MEPALRPVKIQEMDNRLQIKEVRHSQNNNHFFIIRPFRVSE